MNKICFFVCVFLLSLQSLSAQETAFQIGHTHDILTVKFSPDDKTLISYSAGDARLTLWQVETGKAIWQRKTSFLRKANERYFLRQFDWSKDQTRIVTKGDNDLFATWNAKTGESLGASELKPNLEMFAANKKSVSIAKDYSEITVVDDGTKETKIIKKFGNDSAFDTSNNGEMIAEGGGWGDASIRITNIKTGEFWFLDGHPSVVGAIAFSPDGKFLAVGGSDKIVYIFDVSKQSVAAKLTGGEKPINSLAFSPDGAILISSEKSGNLRVWDWQNAKPLKDIKSEEDIFGVEKIAFGSNGKFFLTKSDRTEFRLWNAKTFELARNFKTAEKYESSSGNMSIGYDAVPVESADFSRDGTKIVSAHADDTLRIWDATKGEQLKKFKACENVTLAAFASDDKRIVVYCDKEDKETIRIYDADAGKEVFRFDAEETGFIEQIALSPDAQHFATSDIGGNVWLWDLNEAKPIRKHDIGFSGDDSIAFSPDGKTFAVGGRNQNLFLFDAATGNKLWQLIPSYQPSKSELQLEAKAEQARRAVEARQSAREKQAELETPTLVKQIAAKFSHYGETESYWNQRIVESGARNKSKLILPRDKATVAWFRLTNNSDLPISIDTNSGIFNPKCKGLCDGAEIDARYVIEMKNGKTRVNGFDMYSKTVLPQKTTVYFSVALDNFAASKAVYLGFTFQKDNPDDEDSNDYGTEQKLFVGEPK